MVDDRRKKDEILLQTQYGLTEELFAHKQAEKALRKSEEKYRLLFEDSHDAIYITDTDGVFVDINPAFMDLFGYSKEEMKELTALDFHIDPRNSADMLNEIRKNDFVKDYEVKLRRSNRTIADCLISANTRTSLDGVIIGYQGIIHDITEQKVLENNLIRSEKKYRQLFEKSADAILIIEDSSFIDCNQATVEMLGYSDKHELLNTHPSELSPELQPDGRKSFEKADEMMKIALEKGSHRFEWDHMKSNGEIFPVEVLLTAVNVDEKKQILHTVWRDITARKRAENELQQSHESLESIASIQSKFISKSTRHEIFEEILDDILGISESQFGFIGEVRKDSDGKAYLKFYAISNIAWDKESRKYYEENYEMGMEFTNLDTLFGEVLKTGKTVISNNPSEDKRSGGTPRGHPALDSFIGIPLYIGDTLIGMVGLANRPGGYESEIIDDIDPYLKTTASIVRSYKLYRHRIETENELIESQKQLRNLSAHLQSVREEERTEIARDIHDDLGQTLTVLGMDLEWVKKNTLSDNIKLKDKIDEMLELVGIASDTVQTISTELRPGLLDEIGLGAAMEWQISEFVKRATIKCNIKQQLGKTKIDNDRSTVMFRIFQELLTNILKHSRANKVSGSIKIVNNSLILKLKDNGVGLSEKELSKGESFGILGMRERVLQFEGEFNIKGQKGKGVVVEVKIPLSGRKNIK